MPWIDSHVHIGNDIGGISASYDDVRALIDQSHIDKAVVFCLHETDGINAGNNRIRKIVQSDADMNGLFRIDPAQHTPDDLYDRDSFAGFKMHPRSQNFSMQRVHQHLATIGKIGKPVLIHTGAWSKRAHPEAIIEASHIHPNTTIIAAHNTKGYLYHASNDWRQQFADADNLYMDLSLNCTAPGLEELVDLLGSDRILFATDYPYARPEPLKTVVRLASLTEEQKQDIAHRNARRLFF